MIDYLVPSLDTTISGIASALALFALHPEQWDTLRAEPSLLPNAINEVLRYESPLRAFTRKLLQPTEIGDTEVPAESRVQCCTRRRTAMSTREDPTCSTSAAMPPDIWLGHGALRGTRPVLGSRLRLAALCRVQSSSARDTTFVSGEGVGLNGVFNRLSRGTTLNSDGDQHDQRRKLVAHRLLPRACGRLATPSTVRPSSWSPRPCGITTWTVSTIWRPRCRYPWCPISSAGPGPPPTPAALGRSHIRCTGPLNRNALKSVRASLQILRFSKHVVRHRSVMDGSMGHDILAAADAGELAHGECTALMIDYLVPSLDTTISGIASALALFALHPDQWDALRARPSLLPNAINEVLRYESPLRAFTRKSLQPTEIGGRSQYHPLLRATAAQADLGLSGLNAFAAQRARPRQISAPATELLGDTNPVGADALRWSPIGGPPSGISDVVRV